jgi:dephospho-CoA kinase
MPPSPHRQDAAKPAVRTIGLTGGIGSGKSTVAALMQALGAAVIDADAIAHALTAPHGAALPRIVERFGPQALAADGSMDRAWMRERVFHDPAAKQALEAILHPMIGEAMASAAAAVPADRPVVFDVPLLVEGLDRWRARVDRILVVDCSEATQIERVTRRNGWSAQAVQDIIARQASRADRRAAADAVILNDGIDLATLQQQAQAVWQRWFAATD